MFYINRESKEPIYQQLYSQFIKQISSGQLAAGEKLPSTRNLSKTLCISINTVKTVYFQLTLEGYVSNRPGAGYYIEKIPIDQFGCTASIDSVIKPIERKNEHVYRFDLQYGDLDAESFPIELWQRYTKEVLYSHNIKQIMKYGDPRGEDELRYQIARYLQSTRGVNCSPEQIIITCGMQYSLGVVAHLLGDEVIAFENPGYSIARKEFLNHRLKVLPIPILKDGIDLGVLEQSGAGLVYTTPSHQFPMGFVMPISKRLQLLAWSGKYNAYIIEDDYDCELRYHNQPIPAMQGISNSNRVIYMGTFSKLLSPSLRISYLVLPPELSERYNSVFEGTFSQCSWLQQKVLANFMKDGHWERQIRRMVTGNCKKHDLILNGLRKILPDSVQIHGVNAGTHFMLEFPEKVDIYHMLNRATEQNIKLYTAQDCWIGAENFKHNMILLGYTGLKIEAIPQMLVYLEKAWRDL